MIPYIDMHCDTLMAAYCRQENSILQLPEQMLDINRLREGGAKTQFFAIFMLPDSMRKDLGECFPQDREYMEALLAIYRHSLQQQPGVIAEARNRTEYLANEKVGRINGILSLEDGRAAEGKIENLEWMYREGIRMIALTWNYENCFGYPNAKEADVMQKGLKPFGKEAIEVMNDLGMIIDVSHLSDGGFWDVADLSKKPFVASHSNCRAISPHQRNLSDEMIRTLADRGGVMGLNFCGAFLNEDAKSSKSTIPHMIAHLKHMVQVGGIEVAAIGTDFDGIGGELEIPDCTGMQRLWDALAREGFRTGEIEKIAYQNVERVLKEI